MLEKVEALCQMLDIMPIERSHLTGAVKLRPYDYEDAVQYLSSLPNRPDVIITRDKRGFSSFCRPFQTALTSSSPVTRGDSAVSVFW